MAADVASDAQSSDAAVIVEASAPGKVIVFGEHAVVHGHLCIAGSISLRAYAKLTIQTAEPIDGPCRFDHNYAMVDATFIA